MPQRYPVSVKSETDTTFTLTGLAVAFDAPDDANADLTDEFFTKSSDLWLDRLGGPVRPLLYDHGQTKALGDNVLGTATLAQHDEGVFFEAEISRAQKYANQVHALAQAGVLGASVGGVLHLIRRQPMAGKTWLKSFPVAELSLTVHPAEPRTIGVQAVKSLAEYADGLKALLPDEEEETPAHEPEPSAPVAAVTITRPEAPEPRAHEDTAMSAEDITALQGEVAAIKSGQESLNSKLEQLLQHMQDEPAVRNAGYFTVDGGTADKGIKSFGDFLLAIRRGDSTRLKSVYGAVKDLAEATGTQGGYLVPVEHRTELLQVAIETSPMLGLVRTIPVMADAGTWPALDQYTAPTAGAGNTAFAAGIVATNAAEAAALTETQATFKEIQWRVNKTGGYTEVSNELIADSATAIEALLRGLFAIAVAAKRERNILRGSGVGEPLGILNAPALVSISPASDGVFGYVDALTMASRFKGVSGNVRWIMHQSVLPDFGGSSWTQGNNIIRIEDAFPYGKPILSEHMPQANYDDVVLVDLGAYLLFERQSLSIAYSEHAAFTTDKGTWRFTERLDGQPWQKAAITLADPEGSYTVSPFVLHHDA